MWTTLWVPTREPFTKEAFIVLVSGGVEVGFLRPRKHFSKGACCLCFAGEKITSSLGVGSAQEP